MRRWAYHEWAPWLLAIVALAWPVWALLNWAVFQAVWVADLPACQAAVGQGACWGVVAEKWRVILFGRYPSTLWWRPALSTVLWTAALWLCTSPRFSMHARATALAVALPLGLVLMGGQLGPWALTEAVPTGQWGGLPLTLLISITVFLLACPLALLLALGRHFGRGWLGRVCAVYIDVARALPLVSVLFLAAYVLPRLLKGSSFEPDLLWRVVATIAFFTAAYLAEVLRGGFQAVPRSQYTAALALGLSPAQAVAHVVLPQALRLAAPNLVNSFITLFKDCSLVAIVALFELTGSLGLAVSGDVQWRDFYLEALLFVAVVYWVYCRALAKQTTTSHHALEQKF